MPIYEFGCTGCGHVFEELVLPSDRAASVPCPYCESLKTEKVPTAPGGYKFNSGGSSTRPRSAGSFKRVKK